jgi:hypothetical protein
MFWPLAAGGGLASLYGGYKLTDKLLDMRRKAEMDTELEDAKQQYMQQVQERLKSAAHVDETDAPELLDELAADGISKLADLDLSQLQQGGSNMLQGGTGMYAAYALLAALGSGKLMHDYMRKRSPRKITEQALQQRARQRFGMTPPTYISEQDEKAITP